ncbi:MAG: hypothetical protein QF724_01200 [Planctomycetota bacterium]|nr:hypothetical protein [Planctomycetota bacterium]MDP6837530.1 hypothetical protein [Planctomycetota bacterium]MDP6954567.1 hypothetical protein [Planctomycetota bacterium]
MKTFLAIPAILLSCNSVAMLAPTEPQASASATVNENRFPAATDSLTLRGGEDGSSLADMLAELSRATGITITIDLSSRSFLPSRSIGLLSDVEVPAAEAYSFVAALLLANEFHTSSIHGGQTPMLEVVYEDDGSLAQCMLVSLEELEGLAEHQSLLVETALDLKYADARAFSKSMRSVFGRSESERLVATGGAGQLRLSGSVKRVTSMVAAARGADRAAFEAESVDKVPAQKVSKE